MEELLFKILEREVTTKTEITSIELVYIMNDFNHYYDKNISIFDIIDCESIEDIYDLYK